MLPRVTPEPLHPAVGSKRRARGGCGPQAQTFGIAWRNALLARLAFRIQSGILVAPLDACLWLTWGVGSFPRPYGDPRWWRFSTTGIGKLPTPLDWAVGAAKLAEPARQPEMVALPSGVGNLPTP